MLLQGCDNSRLAKKLSKKTLDAVSAKGRYAGKSAAQYLSEFSHGKSILSESGYIKESLLDEVRIDGASLESAPSQFKNDKDVVLAAVSQNGLALQYATLKLKKDYDVVSAAVSNNGSALRFVSESLCNTKDIVLKAVKQNGRVLENVIE